MMKGNIARVESACHTSSRFDAVYIPSSIVVISINMPNFLNYYCAKCLIAISKFNSHFFAQTTYSKPTLVTSILRSSLPS